MMEYALWLSVLMIICCEVKVHGSDCLGEYLLHSSGSRACFWILSGYPNPSQGKSQCNAAGGDLATIPDLETNTFAQQYLANIGETGKSPAINVKDYDVNGGHVFQTHDGAPVTYTNFEGGQPQVGEECVVMRGTTGRWFDILCHQGYGAMCSKDIPPCPGEVLQHSSGTWTCFFDLSGSPSPTQGQTQCQAQGGTLATIPDEETNIFARQFMENIGKGANSLAINVKDYYINGGHVFETFAGDPQLYTNFEGGQPQVGEECVVMRGSNGRWFDIPCTQYYGAFCSKFEPSPPTTVAPTTTEALTTTEAPTTAAPIDPYAVQSCDYHIHKNTNLNVVAVKSITSRSKIDCVRKCLQHNTCLSVNIMNGDTLCLLNSESHLTTPALVYVSNSVYVPVTTSPCIYQ